MMIKTNKPAEQRADATSHPPRHHKSHDEDTSHPPRQHATHDAPMKPGRRPGC